MRAIVLEPREEEVPPRRAGRRDAGASHGAPELASPSDGTRSGERRKDVEERVVAGAAPSGPLGAPPRGARASRSDRVVGRGHIALAGNRRDGDGERLGVAIFERRLEQRARRSCFARAPPRRAPSAPRRAAPPRARTTLATARAPIRRALRRPSNLRPGRLVAGDPSERGGESLARSSARRGWSRE